jgi:hypothetical protein
MPITQAFCSSFKRELLAMEPHRATDVYKIALYTAAARLDDTVSVYSPANEIPETGDYLAGGQVLVGFSASLEGTTGLLSWTTDPRWTNATIAAAGALIYNSTRANRTLAVLDFGGVIRSTSGPFLVALPAAKAATALIRIR